MGPRHGLAVRVLAEFLAIFAGAVLALSVDGWAERRSEEQEATAGLELVMADLKEDSVQFAAVRVRMNTWADATASLLLQWANPSVPSDSIARAFDTLTEGEALQLSTAGFDGLRDSNRLRFIKTPTVATGLQHYYQVRQPQVAGSFDHTIELVDELPRLAATYVEYGSDEAARARWQPLTTAGARLRVPWIQASRDPVLHQSLVWFGRWTGYVVQLLEESEAEVGGLLAQVREEIQG